MADTHYLLSTTTLTSAASTVTLSSIPSTYTDLKILISARDGTYAAAMATGYMTFNGTSTNYNSRLLTNNAGTIGGNNGVSSNFYIGNIPGNTALASTFSNVEVYIANYASSNNKTLSLNCVPENNSGTVFQSMLAGVWSNSAAVSSVTFTSDGNYAAGSTFYLYGIKNS